MPSGGDTAYQTCLDRLAREYKCSAADKFGLLHEFNKLPVPTDSHDSQNTFRQKWRDAHDMYVSVVQEQPDEAQLLNALIPKLPASLSRKLCAKYELSELTTEIVLKRIDKEIRAMHTLDSFGTEAQPASAASPATTTPS